MKNRDLIFFPSFLISLVIIAVATAYTFGPVAVQTGNFLANRYQEWRFADESRVEWPVEKLQLISGIGNAAERQKNWCESGTDTVANYMKYARWYNQEVDHHARVVMRYMHGSQYRGVEATLPQKIPEYCAPPRRKIR